MIKRTSGVSKASLNVFAGQIGEIGEQFINFSATCQRIEHIRYTHPRSGNNWPATANLRIDDDAISHGGRLRLRRLVVKHIEES